MANPFPKYVFSRTDQLILALIVLGFMAAFVAAILSGNNGVFTYTFDDAYIHLSVAENIFHGTYGINAGEFSAPASSILWPVVLALFSWTTFFTFMPFVLNVLCSIATLIFIYRTMIVALSKVRGTEVDLVNRAAAVILAVLIALATNTLGMAFTGMEHSAQILLESILLYGLVRFLLEGDSRRMVYVAAVLLPLVRFEGLALSVAVLIVMFIMDSRKHALVATAVLGVLMYGFGLFLFANSGWFLPASVLLKGGFFSVGYGAGHFVDVFFHVINGSRTQPLMYSFLVLLPAFLHSALVSKDRISTAWTFVAVFVLVGHFALFGNGGDRYLVPVYVVAAIAMAVYFRVGLQGLFRRNVVIGAVLVLALAGMTHTANYFYQKKIPLSSGNIYEQHYTMHRFVTEYYRQPVAVNDIGYVSYRNPYYVLDLAGLGDYGVMAIPQPLSAATMDSLVSVKGTHLVMIYNEWFSNIPGWWIEIGSFDLQRRKTRAAGARVTLYVADSSMLHYARTELKAFRRECGNPALVRIADDAHR